MADRTSVWDEAGSLHRDLTDMKTYQQMLEIAAMPSSVFVVLHNGWPLVANTYKVSETGKRLRTVSWMKLRYSAVASVLTGSNLIYLGTPGSSPLSDAASIKPGSSDDQSSVAHFCIDLTSSSADEVTGLRDQDVDAELIHPFSFLRLSSDDRMLYSRAWPILDWHRRNQFCPVCGSLTSMSEAGYKRVCQNSSCLTHRDIQNVSYPRVDPSVICAVVSTDHQCLLVRKPTFPSQMYSLVAGFTDAGENLEQACVREVYEEVGVNISDLRYHSSQFWPGPSVLMMGYMAQASSLQKVVVDTKELEDAQWFHRSEVVSMLVHEHSEHLFIPPPAALAHKLIKSWVLGSAFM